MAEANLSRHLPGIGDTPLRVLDLAGGDGGDALRLAAHGHHVTILDHAPEMLTTATERATTAGVTDHIACIHADIEDLPTEVVTGAYDVVLCHNLLQYRDNVTATLAAALAPGGLLSVMAINRHSAPLTTAIRVTPLHNSPQRIAVTPRCSRPACKTAVRPVPDTLAPR